MVISIFLSLSCDSNPTLMTLNLCCLYIITHPLLLKSFMDLNYKIETGSEDAIKQLDKAHLFKLVASNNTVITNVLSKLGIFEGSDAAWENAEYHNTWQALRADFELDYRYKDLSLKLDIIKDNSRFFLGVLESEKGTKLEWIIILLIAVEIVIGSLSLSLDYAAKRERYLAAASNEINADQSSD
jgi:uncharacterized Rmd1/YagE family protein